MSGRITGGGWSGTSWFLTGAFLGCLTVCLTFCLAPVSFCLALGVGVEPTAAVLAVLAAAEPIGVEPKGLDGGAVVPLLGGRLLGAELPSVTEAVLVPSAGGSGAGVGRRTGVGIEPTFGREDVVPVFLGIT